MNFPEECELASLVSQSSNLPYSEILNECLDDYIGVIPEQIFLQKATGQLGNKTGTQVDH